MPIRYPSGEVKSKIWIYNFGDQGRDLGWQSKLEYHEYIKPWTGRHHLAGGCRQNRGMRIDPEAFLPLKVSWEEEANAKEMETQ